MKQSRNLLRGRLPSQQELDDIWRRDLEKVLTRAIEGIVLVEPGRNGRVETYGNKVSRERSR